MASFVSKMQAGFRAFREAYMSADLLDDRLFTEAQARRLRYDVLWALYENTAYRDLHTWSKKLRADYGLYRYIRGIYNPAFRLVEFHAAHLMGGALDPDAGDGETAPSAVPISDAQASLRKAIATLWRASNWQVRKDIWTRQGACFGDVALQVVDDPLRGKVYLQVVHPGTITALDLDPFGNVKGYTIEEQRPDPRPGARPDAPRVWYREVAHRDGQDVVYQTFLNSSPYDWSGGQLSPEWREPYGFIPMVVTKHLDVGLDWGWSELHAGLPKFREIDDIASALSDQIRKSVNSPWLFSGVDNPNGQAVRVPRTPATPQQPEASRQEVPALYGPVGADAKALVAPLDINGVGDQIKAIIAEIERDYPELQMDIWTAGGDASGRALRVARQRVTTKVQMRRANYDDALVRAQQMAIAIGGHRGYAGYGAFSLDSYAAGKLDHQIGERPVFEADPADDLEAETALWRAAKEAKAAGVDLVVFLKRQGWSEPEIAEVETARAAQQQRQLELAQAAAGPGNPQDPANPDPTNQKPPQE